MGRCQNLQGFSYARCMRYRDLTYSTVNGAGETAEKEHGFRNSAKTWAQSYSPCT